MQSVRSHLPLLAAAALLACAASWRHGQANDTMQLSEVPQAADYDADAYLQWDDTECSDAVGYQQEWVEGAWWGGLMEKYRFRHSARDGRWSGKGEPLRGTSWLNRPYDFGLETGAFVMGSDISSNNSRNNDVLAAAHLGWDWDHYWGTQFRVAWTTPELVSAVPSDRPASNNVLLYDVTMLYYPWGDTRVRPYLRFGLGLTDLDFITPAGVREDDTLYTLPIGIGVKYQTKRWMALRAEVVDHLTLGQNSASDMQNFTLTFGLEWRFGGRPTNHWSSPTRRNTW